jgi:hypothetical protein
MPHPPNGTSYRPRTAYVVRAVRVDNLVALGERASPQEVLSNAVNRLLRSRGILRFVLLAPFDQLSIHELGSSGSFDSRIDISP